MCESVPSDFVDAGNCYNDQHLPPFRHCAPHLCWLIPGDNIVHLLLRRNARSHEAQSQSRTSRNLQLPDGNDAGTREDPLRVLQKMDLFSGTVTIQARLTCLEQKRCCLVFRVRRAKTRLPGLPEVGMRSRCVSAFFRLTKHFPPVLRLHLFQSIACLTSGPNLQLVATTSALHISMVAVHTALLR